MELCGESARHEPSGKWGGIRSLSGKQQHELRCERDGELHPGWHGVHRSVFELGARKNLQLRTDERDLLELRQRCGVAGYDWQESGGGPYGDCSVDARRARGDVLSGIDDTDDITSGRGGGNGLSDGDA